MANKARNKVRNRNILIGVLVVAILAMAGIVSFNIGGGGERAPTPGEITDPDTGEEIECLSDTGLSSYTPNVFNGLNTTTSENYDVTLYLTDKDGNIIVTSTDTTTPTAANIGCGFYYPRIIRTNANEGDSSEIKSLTVNSPNEWDAETGKLTIKGATAAVRIISKQHGVLEFKTRDNIGDGFMFDSSDKTADFDGDGVTFTSVTNNATATNENLGLDLTIEARSTVTDVDFNDLGTLIAVEMPTSSWNVPTLSVDGVSVTVKKGVENGQSVNTLNSEEGRLLADYEYVYEFNQEILDAPNSVKIQFDATLLAGVSSVSADVQIDYLSIGDYLSTDGQSIKRGAATDAATAAAVYDVMDTNYDLT